ncbi:secretory carrier-associated membrane protein 3 [Angomonas deanei]|uniref:SCAMP family, putative n=1 Tax=Angomonas deanei TaxID=59799 RepID=A0A7G2CCV2_9TRYP|nr:secretory carrier-associated membrane protein 3 [Angomonas deanei]CAD2216543.1 SCAMP family, putative [Angomonas deanei]|eukprot:EPY42489.1 secretory carrier-associated membrane protein 3 [Angomonas deanei]
MSTIITEEMVLAKEAENEERRKEIQKARKSMPSTAEPDPNFPPECCCVKPLIYHNIKEEIPSHMQRFMYILCGLYLSLLVLIVYNIVVSLLCFIFHAAALQFGLSFLYLLGLPGSFIVWYFNCYSALARASRVRQVFAIAGLFIGFLFDAWMAIGVTNFGGCGWIMFISVMGFPPTMITVLIAAILWTLHGIAMFIMFVRFWKASNSILKKGARFNASVEII